MESSPSTRPGNVQRAAWCHSCRLILAQHLGDTSCCIIATSFLTQSAATKLGITIEPEQVRLKPRPKDGYSWLRQPEREHLFARQISKHSIGAYIEICREVGISIKAISQPGEVSGHGIKVLERSLAFLNESNVILIYLVVCVGLRAYFKSYPAKAECKKIANELLEYENKANDESQARHRPRRESGN